LVPLLLTAAMLGGEAEAKKKAGPKGPLTAKATKAVNQAIPDGVSAPGSPGILRSTIAVGRKFKGTSIADVNLTFQTAGASAASANDLRFRLTAPSGATTTLLVSPIGQSIGPLTLDDETAVRTCNDPNPPCFDPDRTLGPPYAGRASVAFSGLYLLDGGPVRGNWTLRVSDVGTGETSTLSSWGLEIATEPRVKPGKPVEVTRALNAAIPDSSPGADGQLLQTVKFGKKFKGRSIEDVDVTLQTTGSMANAADDLRMDLISPRGNTSDLAGSAGAPGFPGQSVGPLTFDDETNIDPCFDDTPPCGDPDTLPIPFTGVAQPRGELSALDGGPIRGTWTLRVIDGGSPGTTSVLNAFTLRVVPGGVARSASRGAKAQEAKKKKKKKKRKGAGVVNAALAANQPVPDAGVGVPGVLRSTIKLGKKQAGLRISDVNVTTQTSGVGAAAADDLTVRLTAPNGATSDLWGEVDAQSVGPLTLDDEAPAEFCNSSTPPCDAPESTLIAPFAGATRPEAPLRIMDGGPIRGTWTLTVYDASTTETSTLSSWRLAITPD
jgi:subtilisin-like proprotein convertase family protein